MNGRWTATIWSAGSGGFGLGRDADGEPRVDPRWGARGFAGWQGRLFEGDLGVALRITGDAIGRRELDAPGATPLEAYGTLGATATATLGEATVVLEGVNLEDRVRPEVWVDPQTGVAARGAGRELRLAVRLKLYN